MADLRKVETIVEPGNWLLFVSAHHTQAVRIKDDDTVMMKGYEQEDIVLRLPRLSALAKAISAFWRDGAEQGLDEFRVN